MSIDFDLQGLDLPQPDRDGVLLSNQLAEIIIARIKNQDGLIGFNEYMQLALYEPGLGYYSAPTPKFGIAGDFVTAPEISPLFGRCMARQLDSLFAQGCRRQILEFGAGNGMLCEQVLKSAPDIERYLILDLSAELKDRQHRYLKQQLPVELFHKIEWLSGLPEDFDGIVVANEVLDAMPVHVLQKQGNWLELGVAYDGQRFVWQSFAPGQTVLAAIESIEAQQGELPEQYCCELNLNYAPWFKALAESCRQCVVLIIDYGYEQQDFYHPARSSGSLTCHYQHRVHDDPLVYPGLQDITAFVDFDACADAAEQAGFELVGLVDQGRFLLANGLLEEAQQLIQDSDGVAQLAISQQVQTLSLPEEMGEKFKVLALQKNQLLAMPAMRRDWFHG